MAPASDVEIGRLREEGGPSTIYLFLDFDGVLHPSWLGEAFAQVGPLSDVVADFDEVLIVVSSSWRKTYNLYQLRSLCGPDLGKRIVGATPLMLINEQLGAVKPAGWRVRHEEIALWLAINASCGREDADPAGFAAVAAGRGDWIALDDWPDFFPAACPQLIVSHEDGLTPENLLELRTRLVNLREGTWAGAAGA